MPRKTFKCNTDTKRQGCDLLQNGKSKRKAGQKWKKPWKYRVNMYTFRKFHVTITPS